MNLLWRVKQNNLQNKDPVSDADDKDELPNLLEKPEDQYKAWYGPSGHQFSVLQIRSDVEDIAGQMLKILT